MNFSQLDDIISTSNDSVIELDNDFIKEESEFDAYYDGITIDRNLTINGNNHKIDANNNGRIFDIKLNCEVVLTNITFANGNITKMGGAIHSNGQLTLYNCVFINNSARGNGGAIYALNDVTVINSSFEDNFGLNEGGAIYTHKNVEATDSEFKNNHVYNYPQGFGGAISADTTFIENCNFINNSANIRGGSIISDTVYVIRSNFTNSQSGYGSAISGNTITVKSSTFNRNTGIDNGVVYGSDITVYDSNFTHNLMTYGGAVCGNTLTINNSYFESNVGIHGGVLNFDNGIISNSTFKGNTASIDGGAITVYGLGNITDCVFIENSAAGNGGGAIYNDGILRLSDNVFINNNGTYGSTIYNNHILYLNNNSITSSDVAPIENEGFINSPVTVIILNNSTVDCSLGETITLDAIIQDDSGNQIKGKVIRYHVNGEVIVSDEDFKASYTVNSTEEQVISAVYAGATNVTVQNATINVKIPTSLIGNNTSIYYNNGAYHIQLIDEEGNCLVNKTISITINGVEYNKTTNEDGIASLNIHLNSGNYIVTAKFNGDDEYLASNILTNLEVKSTIDSDNLVKFFKNGSQFIATFFDNNGNLLINQSVQFNVNGVIYSRVTDSNGQAKLNINLNPGQYVITSYNNLTKESQSATISVIPILVDNENLVKYYKNDSKFVVKALDDRGNPCAGVDVVFNINGVFYTKTTDENGVAALSINLNPGEYIITSQFNGYQVSNTISVLPLLYGQDLQMNYNDGSTYNVALVDEQGNPLANETVSFNINGTLYEEVTDINGIARLNIDLMPDSYIVTASYNGCNISNKISVL